MVVASMKPLFKGVMVPIWAKVKEEAMLSRGGGDSEGTSICRWGEVDEPEVGFRANGGGGEVRLNEETFFSVVSVLTYDISNSFL